MLPFDDGGTPQLLLSSSSSNRPRAIFFRGNDRLMAKFAPTSPFVYSLPGLPRVCMRLLQRGSTLLWTLTPIYVTGGCAERANFAPKLKNCKVAYQVITYKNVILKYIILRQFFSPFDTSLESVHPAERGCCRIDPQLKSPSSLPSHCCHRLTIS